MFMTVFPLKCIQNSTTLQSKPNILALNITFTGLILLAFLMPPWNVRPCFEHMWHFNFTVYFLQLVHESSNSSQSGNRSSTLHACGPSTAADLLLICLMFVPALPANWIRALDAWTPHNVTPWVEAQQLFWRLRRIIARDLRDEWTGAGTCGFYP